MAQSNTLDNRLRNFAEQNKNQLPEPCYRVLKHVNNSQIQEWSSYSKGLKNPKEALALAALLSGFNNDYNQEKTQPA